MTTIAERRTNGSATAGRSRTPALRRAVVRLVVVAILAPLPGRALARAPAAASAGGADVYFVANQKERPKTSRRRSEPGVELTQMGYEFWPESLEQTIRYAAARARAPVYVTENGVTTEDDARRVEYIRRALAGVRNCLEDGIDVRGYVHWSPLDTFEWVFGYRPKSGLVAVNRETQERTVKPSARFLGEIARRNGA